ncbi:MAG: hydroxymethylglutaryl-CoA reductase, degradative [Candidatus Hydrothermarchaeota archaeon]|nr:hydroxymethylglutaryl-CoA reductase, degradative [Candidatus Hydrothermarchaeota archaeon]
MKTSKLSGFYKLSPEERLRVVKEFSGLRGEETTTLNNTGALGMGLANRMIENVIGGFTLPLGVATNFRINSRDYLIPMTLEEPSVVAAASNVAKMARAKGGFTASATESRMIGQVQLVDVANLAKAGKKIIASKNAILGLANEQDPVLGKFGGGAMDLEVRELDTRAGKMLVVHLIVDCRDAMGANAVNTMAEAIAPRLESLSGGRALLRIISNLAVHRLVRVKAVFAKDVIGGEEVVDAVLKAYAFAEADEYRCATHNKGIMNGIIAVALATGNDTRALEAGAHAYAALNGSYIPLTRYERNIEGDLVGEIELPLAVGLVGGATTVHPAAKACVKILGVKTAPELAQVMASVGLAQNFAALRALATEGIQRGHMSLHARNIAVMAGAEGALVDRVAERLVAEKKIRVDRAKEILAGLRVK